MDIHEIMYGDALYGSFSLPLETGRDWTFKSTLRSPDDVLVADATTTFAETDTPGIWAGTFIFPSNDLLSLPKPQGFGKKLRYYMNLQFNDQANVNPLKRATKIIAIDIAWSPTR